MAASASHTLSGAALSPLALQTELPDPDRNDQHSTSRAGPLPDCLMRLVMHPFITGCPRNGTDNLRCLRPRSARGSVIHHCCADQVPAQEGARSRTSGSPSLNPRPRFRRSRRDARTQGPPMVEDRVEPSVGGGIPGGRLREDFQIPLHHGRVVIPETCVGEIGEDLPERLDGH